MRKELQLAGLLLSTCFLSALTGCLSIKAPERININGRPEPVDTRRVPPTRTHEEARQELARAYQNVEYWQRKAEEYRRERDECRERRD